jgi:hypothetical protein
MPGGVGEFLSPLKGSLGFKVGLEGGYSYGTTWAKSENDSSSITVARNVSVMAEGNSFEFEARTRRCLLVYAKSNLLALLGKDHTPPQGLYLCAKNTQSGKHVESYYLISQSIGVSGSPFSDPAAAASAPWRMFLRGSKTLDLFKKVLQNSAVEIVLEEFPEEKVLKEFTEFRTSQEYPGMLSETKE